MQQETLSALQKDVTRSLLEQRAVLDEMAKTLQSARTLNQLPETPVPQATRTAVTIRGFDRALVSPIDGQCQRTPSAIPVGAIVGSTDPSPIAQERSFSTLCLQDRCSELDNKETNPRITLSEFRGRMKNYLMIVIFLARELCDLFWLILASDPRLLALFAMVRTRIPAIPSIELAINDSIRLIDAFGHERRLQYTTHRYFSVFKSFLMEDYRSTPSGLYIAKNRFRLLDVRAPEPVLINEESWSSLVRPGAKITLSVILTKVTAAYEDICLGCGRRRNWSWISHRYACSCGLVFYRQINNATGKGRISASLDDPLDPAADHRVLGPEATALETPKTPAARDKTLMGRETQNQALRSSYTAQKQSDETDEPTPRTKSVRRNRYINHNAFSNLDRRNITIFKSVVFETTQRYQGPLSFHLSPCNTQARMNWRRHREITVNSEPYIIDLLYSFGCGYGNNRQQLTTANISLQVDGLGNLWIQCESPQPEICVNGTPLWEARTFREGSSTRRRLEAGDHIDVKDEKATSRFFVRPCEMPQRMDCLPLLRSPYLRREHLNPEDQELPDTD